MVFPIAYLITPFTVLLPSPILQQLAIFCVMLLKCCAGVFAFPCCTIMLTNSARSLLLLGTLNGVATSLSAIGRALGPTVAGNMFTFGIDIGYVILPWWTLAFFGMLGNLPTWWLIEMDGFGGTHDSDSEDEDEEEEDLVAEPGSIDEGTRSYPSQLGTGDGTEEVDAPRLSQDEDDFAVEEDPLMTLPEAARRRSSSGSHLDPAKLGVPRRMTSPIGQRGNIGPGGERRLSNGIGQTMNEFGTGGSPYH
jgi:hypothetical protein